MTTASTLGAVQYLTATDPYHYTVENRPLLDLANRDVQLANAIDALGGSVTSVSVATANGLAGTATSGATPVITLTTGVTGVLKGNGTAISAATANTDYLAPPSGTAILKANSSGALANAVAGTDYLSPTGVLSGCTIDGTNKAGFLGTPSNIQIANYTTVLADNGKCIVHPASDPNVRVFYIGSHVNVAWPDGATITFTNWAVQLLAVSVVTDTLVFSPTGGTGARSIPQYGTATARYSLAINSWLISGSGLF